MQHTSALKLSVIFLGIAIPSKAVALIHASQTLQTRLGFRRTHTQWGLAHCQQPYTRLDLTEGY